MALLSWLVVSGFVSSADFHEDTLAELEEKQPTVLELSAASAAASAAIILIPGETATPIADKLADLSSHFLLVLCEIFLEKYLLTIMETVTFSVLIPISCILYILNVIFDWKRPRQLAAKLASFGLLIFCYSLQCLAFQYDIWSCGESWRIGQSFYRGTGYYAGHLLCHSSFGIAVLYLVRKNLSGC